MGARRWLTFGPFNLQPSELAKIAVALVLAAFFASDAQRRREGYGLFELVIPLGVTLLPAALILKQPDLGTALIVMAVGCTQLLFAKVRWVAIVILLVAGLAGGALAFRHLKDYQRNRIVSFLNPEADAKGAGYHAQQSIIAMGSGQGLGKGWGQGTQTYLSFLPEQHTDFIFSVWAEEHGFVGCLLLLVLYFALLGVAVDIAGAARDRFGQFLAVGVAAMLFWHVFINVGMVIGHAAGGGGDPPAHELRRVQRDRHLHRHRHARRHRHATVRELKGGGARPPRGPPQPTSFRTLSSSLLLSLPTTVSTTRPPLKRSSVGMERMPNCWARPGAGRRPSWRPSACPCTRLASASTTGAIALQGWHHTAQKSTSTGVSLFRTSWSKVRSSRVTTSRRHGCSLEGIAGCLARGYIAVPPHPGKRSRRACYDRGNPRGQRASA